MARTGLLLTAVLVLGGCDDAAGGRGFGPDGQSGGKADDAEGEGEAGDDEARVAFLDAVTRCEALADRGRRTIGEARIEQRLAVEETRLECVRAATDATLDSIETKLEGAESTLVGEGEASFNAWREANSEFCDLLVAASEAAVEKDAAVHESRCNAKAEVLLAEAIATYVDLGGAPADPPEAREAYSECYEAFDAAVDQEPTEADAGEEVAPELEAAVAATRELADCIRTATADNTDELATRVAESFPGRGMDNLHEDIAGDFASTAEAADALCNVLGSASIDAGEPEAELQATTCMVSTSIWRGRLLGDVLPDLAPTQPEEPDEDPPSEEPTDPTA